MNFTWTESSQEMHTRTLQFARAHLNEGVVDRDRSHRFSARDWRRCGEFGLAGLCVEERYRGLGLGALDTAHTFEALGQGCEDGGLMFSLGAHLFACVMPIAKHANESLKQEVLPRLATGEWIGANAITEPEAGSDAFALSTLARLDGDSYVIDGVKSYVTNAPVADAFVVYAMTHPELGHLGVNAFVVERTRRGVNVGEPFAKMGLTTSPIASVYFDGCRVPVSSRLGADGAGAGVFADSMGWERTCLFAGYLGAMDRLLERCIDHAKGRKQFGKSIGKQQAVAHRIVDMKLRIESARWLLYRACWLLDRGEKAGLEVACAKLAVSEAAIRGGLDAIQIHGGAGFMVDVGIERLLRDAIGSSIFSGTSEIQRNVIAARLGL